MNARGMDPVLGRFLQIDPMMEYSSPYTYVGNNPLKYIDPTGMSSENLQELFDNAPSGYSAYSRNDEGGGFDRTSSGNCPEEPCPDEDKEDYSTKIGYTSLTAAGAGIGTGYIHVKYQSHLYEQGYIKGLNGNTQLTGRKFSLFNGNSNYRPLPSSLPGTRFSGISKGLSAGGSGLAVLGVMSDTNSLINGNISTGRWGYRFGTTVSTIGIASAAGGPAGFVAGLGFATAEILYDLGQYVRYEWSVQLGNAEVALKKGIWTPNFTPPR